MPLQIKETRIGAKSRFPANYQVSFTGTSKPGELAKLRKKIENSLEKHLVRQRKSPKSAIFKLIFTWEKMRSYKLTVSAKRVTGGNGSGTDTQPKPKNSILPM